MKILFVSTGILKNEDYKGGSLGGIEKQIYGIAQELSKTGHSVFIVRNWKKPLKQENINGITFINIHSWLNIDSDIRLCPIGALLTRLIFSTLANKKIKEINPDVIILSELFSSCLISKMIIPKIYVVHVPPYAIIKENYSKSRFKSFLFNLLEKFENILFQRFNLIIALNNEINQYLQNKGYKSHYIPNGVNIEEYTTENTFTNNYILFGGRLVPEKGVHYLLQAYLDIRNTQRFDKKLLIVGSGPSEHSLKTFVYNHGISDWVEFIPWLNNEEFLKKIKNCYVFVLPSLFECMPVSLLEAMACGKPVVASNIPGSQDIIINGYNGFLFERGNIQELVNFLLIIFKNNKLRENISNNARETIQMNYSFSIIANRYTKIFNLLIG